jgi:inorganic pyrophosphatase
MNSILNHSQQKYITKIITPYGSNIQYSYENNEIYYVRKFDFKFPFHYTIFPNTLDKSNRQLNGILLFKENINQGVNIKVKIIGVFKYIDDNNFLQTYILTIPHDDLKNNIFDIDNFYLEEIKFFFKNIYKIDKKKIKIIGFDKISDATDLYEFAITNYQIKQSGKKLSKKQKLFSFFNRIKHIEQITYDSPQLSSED